MEITFDNYPTADEVGGVVHTAQNAKVYLETENGLISVGWFESVSWVAEQTMEENIPIGAGVVDYVEGVTKVSGSLEKAHSSPTFLKYWLMKLFKKPCQAKTFYTITTKYCYPGSTDTLTLRFVKVLIPKLSHSIPNNAVIKDSYDFTAQKIVPEPSFT